MNDWLIPLSTLTLSRSEIHVWNAGLEPGSDRLESLYSFLAPEEQAKAERFYFAKDRTRYIMARGILRILLGRYLDQSPDELKFTYNSYGKPALAQQADEETLHFNLSHSGSLALYALAWQRRLGIDVEALRLDLNWYPIAKRFFAPSEVASICQLPATEQAHAFFQCWTRKEAYIKAIGKGLFVPLDQFEVSVGGTQSVELKTQWNLEDAVQWSLQALHPEPGYVGAIAIEGHDHQLQYWQFPGLAGIN